MYAKKGKGTQETTPIRNYYEELRNISLASKGDLSKMREPLLIWAHDDTVEPESSYRYRIRLGVFNPIAGTNQFSKKDESLKNKVILWSKFSEVPETVDIPGVLYFFPLRVEEDSKNVNVKIFRHALGYWYSKDFWVKQGEIVGAVDHQPEDAEAITGGKQITMPEAIDYRTGAVLVDVVRMNEWSGWSGRKLHARYYSDMLYSYDGTSIDHFAIEKTNWPRELEIKHRELKDALKVAKLPLRSWTSRADGYRQHLIGGREGYGGEEGGEEEEEMEAIRRMYE
jgi:hypothetical protein